MARVALEGVSKSYPGGVRAIESLDLAIEDGELVVVVGPSGSGKTTILRMIAGLERPTSGEIRIGERVVTGMSPRERDVAYVPQSCPLFPHLNIYRNIAFAGRMRHAGTFLTRLVRIASSRRESAGWTRAAEAERVRAAAGRLGIGHLLERWPRQLSGGERQRVALARALVREPAAFLFDEPLASLDAHLRSELRQEIRELHRQLGRTMLYVTHDQVEALALAERLVVFDQGKVQQAGRPAEVYGRPQNQFVAGFIGNPPMNFLAGEVRQTSHGTAFAAGSWEWRLSESETQQLGNRSVVLGIRPEAVELAPGDPDACLAEVGMLETIGDESWARLRAAGPKAPVVVARLSAAVGLMVGQEVAWQAKAAARHWFEAASGRRIDVV